MNDLSNSPQAMIRKGTVHRDMFDDLVSPTFVTPELAVLMPLVAAGALAAERGGRVLLPDMGPYPVYFSGKVLSDCVFSLGIAPARFAVKVCCPALKMLFEENLSGRFRHLPVRGIYRTLSQFHEVVLLAKHDPSVRTDAVTNSKGAAWQDQFSNCFSKIPPVYTVAPKLRDSVHAALRRISPSAEDHDLNVHPSWLLSARVAAAYHVIADDRSPRLTEDDFNWALIVIRHHLTSVRELKHRYVSNLS